MKTALSDADIAKMVQEVQAMKGVRLVEEDIYEGRITKCYSCEKFEYGSTCMLCGCVMQVRARLKDGRCPKKIW